VADRRTLLSMNRPSGAGYELWTTTTTLVAPRTQGLPIRVRTRLPQMILSNFPANGLLSRRPSCAAVLAESRIGAVMVLAQASRRPSGSPRCTSAKAARLRSHVLTKSPLRSTPRPVGVRSRKWTAMGQSKGRRRLFAAFSTVTDESRCQMRLDFGGHLTDCGHWFRIGLNAVQQDEVVDHPVVARSDHRNSGLL